MFFFSSKSETEGAALYHWLRLAVPGSDWLVADCLRPYRVTFQEKRRSSHSSFRTEDRNGWLDISTQQTCEAKQIVYQFSDQGAATGLAGREN